MGSGVSFFSKSLCLLFHWYRKRKESIQPQVPLRLPCYDFALVNHFPLILQILKRKKTDSLRDHPIFEFS